MRRLPAILALLIGALAAPPATAAEKQPVAPAAIKKLHDLGYPADLSLAIQRWRTDTGRQETGPLNEAESAELLAQPLSEFMAAMVGSPFTGMGLAMRHQTRQDAEREAIRLCKANGGGSACSRPLAVRAEQCVAIVGYTVTIDRRPTYRTSVAISTAANASMNAAKEACPIGASHPELCRPLLSFCGDGREFHVFDDKEPSSPAEPMATN